MKKLYTLLCIIISISLLDVSHAWAQRSNRANAAARKQRPDTRFDLSKIKSKKLTKLSLPTKRPDFWNKGTQPSDSLSRSHIKRNVLAIKSRSHTVRLRLSTARKSATEDIPTRLYVNYKATGSDEGDTWENAIPELADALVFAKNHPEVQEIWVANGFYTPLYDHNYSAEGEDPRDRTFILPAGVQIYGGFEGTETSLAQRRLRVLPTLDYGGNGPVDFATILSGELGEEGYSYHVAISAGDVTGASLDGFFILDGDATGDGSVTVNTIDIPRNAGGGLAIFNSVLTLRNLRISENWASEGSAIAGVGSDFILTNALIVHNNVNERGTVSISDASPVITNVTITENNAAQFGGLFFQGAGTAASIRNSIIYQNEYNEGGPIGLLNDATASFEYSIVEASGGSDNWDDTFGTDAGHNLDEDPLFEDPSREYYGLYLTSPAINKGNNAFFNSGANPDLSAITTDQRSTPRISRGTVDIGALESLYDSDIQSNLTPDDNGILYVKKGGDGDRTGNSWANAAPEVADALFAAGVNPDISDIWVAGGTYYPLYRPDDLSKSDPKSKYNSFLMVEGVYLYGGFAGTETTLEERDLSISANASILSGDFNGDDGFDFAEITESGPDESSENAYMLVSAVGSVCSCGVGLNGFTIEGANNLSGAPLEEVLINDRQVPVGLAAGLLTMGTNITLENAIIRNNVGKMAGGLTVYLGGSSMLNSLVYHNVDAGQEVLRTDDFKGASGMLGIATLNGSIFINSTIAQNLSLSDRPGLHNFFGGLVFANSIVYHNITTISPPADEGTDLTGNTTIGQAVNSIIGGSGGSDNWKLEPGANNFEITDIGGNLDEDPLFKDMEMSDFSLSACSPAIDAGVDFGAEISLTDLAGNPRMFGDFYDMGAYEFQASPGFGVTELAGNGKESSYEFTDNTSHTFAAEKGLCSVDILTLTPTTLTGEVATKVWYDTQVNSFHNAPYLQRHYDIIPANDAENAEAEVTLYFTQAEFDALNGKLTPSEYLPTGQPAGEDNRKSNFRIYQFHGESEDGSGAPSTYGGSRKEIDPDDSKIVWNEELQRWEVTFTVNGFSGFFGGTASQNPLPVRLVSFEGKQTDNQQVKLDWKVVEQESIAAYHVEYSENGKTFKRIGQVTANTLSSSDYSYTDSLPHAGDHSYYRLKIAEVDGKTAYSKIVSIKINAAQTVSAYPIPARNELWIDWKKTGAESAELVDMSGRTLKIVKKLSASQKVDISGLPAGLFVLKVKGSSGLKVMKE